MLTIPEDIAVATNMTDLELQLEIAVMLFEKEKLTLGQAARLAGMPQAQFQLVLASRKIAVHYDVEEFMEDLETLKKMDG